MSTTISRYGNKALTTALLKSAPRMVAFTAVGAIAAEWAGNGFIDMVWGTINRGVRRYLGANEAEKKQIKFLVAYTDTQL